MAANTKIAVLVAALAATASADWTPLKPSGDNLEKMFPIKGMPKDGSAHHKRSGDNLEKMFPIPAMPKDGSAHHDRLARRQSSSSDDTCDDDLSSMLDDAPTPASGLESWATSANYVDPCTMTVPASLEDDFMTFASQIATWGYDHLDGHQDYVENCADGNPLSASELNPGNVFPDGCPTAPVVTFTESGGASPSVVSLRSYYAEVLSAHATGGSDSDDTATATAESGSAAETTASETASDDASETTASESDASESDAESGADASATGADADADAEESEEGDDEDEGDDESAAAGLGKPAMAVAIVAGLVGGAMAL